MSARADPPTRDSPVRLVPMTEERFTPFLEESIVRYADENVRTGRWTATASREASRAEHLRLLPQGLASPDHYLRTIEPSSTGERVGDLWYAVQSEGGPRSVWIYWIGIDEAHRRRGYAAATLRATEDETRRLGLERLGLHVFAFNAGARQLYEQMGFETTNLVMWKRLAR